MSFFSTANTTRVMKEARVLITNAAVVDSTFQELGPGFTTCLQYENITDQAQASRVAQFVAPTNHSAQVLSRTMLATVKDMRHAPSRRHYVAKSRDWRHPRRMETGKSMYNSGRQTDVQVTEEVSREAEAMVVERLQQKLDKIERDQCAGSGVR